MADQFMSNLPFGCHFRPSDSESLVLLYDARIENRFHPAVSKQEIYHEGFDPRMLQGIESMADGKVRHIFTTRKRKEPPGKRVDRRAGCGSWKDRGQAKPIKTKEGIEGVKRQFVFKYNNKKYHPFSDLSINLIMDEYTLGQEGEFEEMALCKIRITLPSKNKTTVVKKFKEMVSDVKPVESSVGDKAASGGGEISGIMLGNNNEVWPTETFFSNDFELEPLSNSFFNFEGDSNNHLWF